MKEYDPAELDEVNRSFPVHQEVQGAFRHANHRRGLWNFEQQAFNWCHVGGSGHC